LIGRGRKGLSTKLHLALSVGGVQSACLSEGQRVDMKVFPKLWELGDWSGIQYVIAYKGYDYSMVRAPIREAKKIPVIPRRANRPLSKLGFVAFWDYFSRYSTPL